jgi:hypothetical protein
VLPRLLEAGEVVAKRPSLAAGNDISRPFDLETNQRVAEFKLSQWKGSDAMRKRQVFKDLVHLAADDSGRTPYLYVVGPAPMAFLRTTTASARWGLDRWPASQSLFVQRFGDLNMAIREFTAGPGTRVQLVDLDKELPGLSLVAALE